MFTSPRKSFLFTAPLLLFSLRILEGLTALKTVSVTGGSGDDGTSEPVTSGEVFRSSQAGSGCTITIGDSGQKPFKGVEVLGP